MHSYFHFIIIDGTPSREDSATGRGLPLRCFAKVEIIAGECFQNESWKHIGELADVFTEINKELNLVDVGDVDRETEPANAGNQISELDTIYACIGYCFGSLQTSGDFNPVHGIGQIHGNVNLQLIQQNLYFQLNKLFRP